MEYFKDYLNFVEEKEEKSETKVDKKDEEKKSKKEQEPEKKENKPKNKSEPTKEVLDKIFRQFESKSIRNREVLEYLQQHTPIGACSFTKTQNDWAPIKNEFFKLNNSKNEE